MTCMDKGNKYRLVRNFTTNVKSIYGLENQFPNNKFMGNTIQFVHKTWGGVWVVIAISSLNTDEHTHLDKRTGNTDILDMAFISPN